MAVINYVDKLSSWFKKFKRYTVSYKKGFFHLSNLANSPYTIIESFDKMPFCKHDRSKKFLCADTLFLKAQLYYCELEDGLWVFVSDLYYKKNLVMTNIYDELLPMDYHFLNLHYSKKGFKSKSMLVNGLTLTDKTWSTFKSGNALSDYHFKDANELNITIYFTNEWFSKQVNTKSYFKNSNYHAFLKSDNTYIFLRDTDLTSDEFYSAFLSLAGNNGDNSKNDKINRLVTGFFKHFIEKFEREPVNEEHFKLSDKDRKYIQKAEKYLQENLLISFPGIEMLAREVGISPTKLKSDFKVIHNQSLYHYYRSHQMQLAHKLLTEKASTVKEVAKLLGYGNQSKFATVFKEQFGVQPSSYIR